MTNPFVTPGSQTGQQPQAVIVTGIDGRQYMQTPQGMVPVTVQQQTGQGDPSRQPLQPWQQQQNVAQPQQQQQQHQPPAIGQDTILRGPGIPQELQGRTLQDGLRVYDLMKTEYLKNRQQPPANAQQPAQPQQNGQQAQQQPNGQPVDARTFYNDPWGNTRMVVEETLKRTLGPMLEPVINQTRNAQAMSVRQQFFSARPDALPYEGAIMQQVASLPPEQQANIGAWDAVYAYVLGQTVLQRQQQTMQPGYQPQPQQQQQQQQQPLWSQPQMPQQQQQRPNVMPFNGFAESSAPSPGALGVQQADPSLLSNFELNIARNSGMTPQQFAQSKADLAAGRIPGMGNGATNVR